MATYMTINGGITMPSVGLGTWSLKDPADVATALNAALEIGYRHIDTAFVYQNEAIIGKVLKDWFSSGKLQRKDLFVTTKLAHDCIDANLVENYMKKSLEALQLDYVDLYLIHSAIGRRKDDKTGEFISIQTDHIAIWKKMEEQVEAGRARAIGLSNFNIEQIENVWQFAKIKPACLQIRIQLHWQQPELVNYCHNKNITVVGYSSLKTRFPRPVKVGNRNRPDNQDERPNILENVTVKELANKYSRTPAQIILRFFLQNNIVMIPKSVNPKRIEENFNLFNFRLEENDVITLKSLNKDQET